MIKIKLKTSSSFNRKIKQAIEQDLEAEIKRSVEDTITELQRVTPKLTGYAASRWDSYQTTKYSVSFSAQNRFFIDITSQPVYFIVNDAPYISYLNAGSSKQAPAYFVEQTLLSNGFVPTLIK